ncbi:hypothetical protein GOODEAATRI_009939 [Goodea atripinnis]|uniref:Uncharacterized protein n=1 Tax=Goodea atripinnis TaxID=208336 RepID=A0ABV0PMB1_9TELE
MAQARAFRTNQTSKWTKSREFQPLTDKRQFEHNSQLKDLFWELDLNVKRTRDGAEVRVPDKDQEKLGVLLTSCRLIFTLSRYLQEESRGAEANLHFPTPRSFCLSLSPPQTSPIFFISDIL